MKNVNRRQLLRMLGSSSVACWLLTSGQVEAQAPADGFKSVNDSSRKRIAERYFPNVTLLTQNGKKVKFYDDLIKDKIVLLNFFYAKCDGICPGTTANLVRVQKLLGDHVGRDVFMYSITLKPEHDTPAVLKRYAEAYHAGPGWTFLTGNPKDIELLRRKLGYTNPDPVLDADKSQHIGMLRYGNEPRQLWAAISGFAKPEVIARTVLWVAPRAAARAA